MAYKAYVTPKYYLETYRGTSIPESELDLRLRDASRHIDSGEPGGAGLRVILVFDQWRKHDADRRMECIPG